MRTGIFVNHGKAHISFLYRITTALKKKNVSKQIGILFFLWYNAGESE